MVVSRHCILLTFRFVIILNPLRVNHRAKTQLPVEMLQVIPTPSIRIGLNIQRVREIFGLLVPAQRIQPGADLFGELVTAVCKVVICPGGDNLLG